MSVIYEYPNKPQAQDLDAIHAAVAASAMVDKAIEFCRWDEDAAILQVVWADALDAADKTILDGIVG